MTLCLALDAWPQQDKRKLQVSGTAVVGDSGTTNESGPADKRTVAGTAASGDSGKSLPRVLAEFGQDEKQIWTSPGRIRFSDTTWLVPLGGLTAGLFVTDRGYSASLHPSSTTMRHYKTVSNVGVAGLVGAGAGLYLLSFPSHNDHWRETGFLAGESALNSLVVVEALKYSARRERPYQGDGSGSFSSGGTSFPSEHAAAAWSIAGVLAHEYPGTLPKLFAYGMASAVSFSRVRSRQHFPSDVVVGSALGYLIGQSVYSRHHDPELGGSAWESAREFISSDRSSSPSHMGSPYVPLDSWIYPALERLVALGYVRTAALGMRPWTRLECARLVSEAEEEHSDADGPREMQTLYQSLAQEFANEFRLMSGERNFHAQLESVYFRSTGISGTPLTDNYHFGQTVVNDYGRPFQEGFNSMAGVSSWTAAGPFVIYARGEYQSAPSAPAPSPAVLGFISTVDGLPPNAPSVPIPAISRLRLLDAYVGMNLANWQISYGKQSLWWGPSESGAMLFTNNAEPLNNMFRISRVSPFRLPSVLGYLGNMRTEFFLGQVSAQQFVNASGVTIGKYGVSLAPQPFISGGKVSFKFTKDFEFGVSKTTLFGGPGNPLTPEALFKSALGFQVGGSPIGDGRSAVDFSYRIPRLRNWLSLYGDAFQEDEISVFNRPYKAAFQAGLYVAQIPGVRKLDLRLEGGTTSPVNFPSCDTCYYWNFQWRNGYTNGGRLMGTWLGRAAQGEALRTVYWIRPQQKVGVELRHRQIDRRYLPQGGSQNDVAVNADLFVKPGFRFSGTVQYERWQIPLLAPSPQSNVTASFQFGWWPNSRVR